MLAFALLLVPVDDGSAAVERLIAALTSLDRVTYSYKRILDYPDEKYHRELSAETYVEFDRTARPVRARFQIEGPKWRQVFDGHALFYQEEGKTAQPILSPARADFVPLAPLKNSILGLATCLTELRERKLASFRLPGSGRLEFRTQNVELGPAGLEKVGYAPRYIIEYDLTTSLPIRIVQHLANEKDTIETSFRDWDLKPAARPESSWLPKQNHPHVPVRR